MSSYNVNERPFQTSPDRKMNKMMNDENENDEMEVISSDDSPSKNWIDFTPKGVLNNTVIGLKL